MRRRRWSPRYTDTQRYWATFQSRSVPDPKDDPILAIAVVGDAELLVSGDKSDMLALDHVEGIPIRSPREALAIALTTEADGDS